MCLGTFSRRGAVGAVRGVGESGRRKRRQSAAIEPETEDVPVALRRNDSNIISVHNGVLLLQDPAFGAHARSRPGSVASCKHSIELHVPEGLDLSALDGAVVIGGQFQGARLASAATAMLVL